MLKESPSCSFLLSAFEAVLFDFSHTVWQSKHGWPVYSNAILTNFNLLGLEIEMWACLWGLRLTCACFQN